MTREKIEATLFLLSLVALACAVIWAECGKHKKGLK